MDNTRSEVKQTKTALAQKLGVSRGMLYYKHKKPVDDEKLKFEIEKVLVHHPAYGHRRIALELSLNRKRILRIMKKFHLMPRKRRSSKFVKPDDLGRPETKYQNLIESFCPIRSNVVWAGDFTHIRFHDNWVYLATVMDIYTREIIGWQLSINHQKDLVIEAFLDAVDKRKTMPVYFHSDQGSEYDSEEYLRLIKNNGIIVSMSRKSSPWENGYQESFYSGFKMDLGSTNHYKELGELIEAIAQTLSYYNNLRIHTRLKMPPVKFRLGREYLFKKMG
ncbi:MAG: IS3 family transposase, partial [Candidatus Staskawiczbacteria bacterium]|nr:IS3 family transposase [Candidatus Staskawiczbacteria bacterium]